ncbi:type 1 glutamine amidotransferase [Phytohalomonas tamaricis]|uniref:type 1 glutamine amidotransferase n=1 Tax=Phytohalomonas tamaricis TaxID=2081032 RepID=UPI000D0ADF1A|nr:type 1 glutamine amidotransferase [Phytohalomonas tamaricis]
MHIYFLQHAAYEDPARLSDWLTGMGHSHNTRHLYAGEIPPQLSEFDALVVLGGPMRTEDPDAHPWIKRERKLIERALNSAKPVLGIGFGAQLIAEALGAIISRGTYTELGWHTVTRSDECELALPATFEAFHCHSDIFGLPDDAAPIGATPASPVQGFSWDDGRVVALQFHLEVTAPWVRALAVHHASALSGSGPYVQSFDEILSTSKRFDRLAPLLDRLLLDWLNTAR